MAFSDLRDWIDAVDALGDLKKVSGANIEEDIGAISDVYQSNPGSEAVLFDDIPGYPSGYRVLSCLLSSPSRIALTFGFDPKYTLKETTKGIQNKLKNRDEIPPKIVKNGPILENIQEGKDVDVTLFPSPLWHEKDGGKYIGTADLVITQDPDTGWVNVGTYRSMIHTKNEVGMLASRGKHGREHMEKYHDRGEPCPVAIVCGVNPELYWASSVEIPHGVCEYDFVGWWRGKPVEVIQSQLTGLPIPANSEIVLEGYIPPNKTRLEGPYGEFLGYYAGGEKEEMVVDVERIYHRNNPILTGSPSAKPPAEETYFRCPIRAANIANALEELGVPGIKDVWCDPAGATRLWVVVSIKQEYAGHAKQVGQLVSQMPQNVFLGKYIIVVDDDVDVFDRADVIWALGTRVHPPRDIHIEDYTLGASYDPIPYDYIYPGGRGSPEKGYYNARVVIDATKLYEARDEYPEVVRVSPELREKVSKKFPGLFDNLK